MRIRFTITIFSTCTHCEGKATSVYALKKASTSIVFLTCYIEVLGCSFYIYIKYIYFIYNIYILYIYIYIHYEWCHTAVCSRRKVNVEEGGQGGQRAVLITKKKK